MTAKDYFNAHKGERMHGYDGEEGVLIGWHSYDNGFDRLIISVMGDMGWTTVTERDHIELVIMRPTHRRYMYVNVPSEMRSHA